MSGIELIKNSELSRVARLLNEFLMLHSRGCKSHTTFSHFFPLSFFALLALCDVLWLASCSSQGMNSWNNEMRKLGYGEKMMRWSGGLMKWNEKCQVLYISSRKTSMKVGNFLSFLRLFSHNFAILLAVTHPKGWGMRLGVRRMHTKKDNNSRVSEMMKKILFSTNLLSQLIIQLGEGLWSFKYFSRD